MEGHDGAVLCVRWTHSGTFLASGSDDSIIMVWLRFPGKSKSFGSKVANIEDWKPAKRLAGHTSDVSGIAWSSDDQYLASIGLDNLVLIWDCQDSAFLLLRRLDLHQGHVNGVAWDPVGQFLATQADDRTVKIWRTTDWKLEANITAPFVDAPMSFFRRLSWSPDGAHIVTPNSMNGPVFVSAVIERNQWTSDISLVGHENVVEVVAYNPQMFLKDKSLPPVGYNICAALALGARNSISIWLTSNSAPLVVLHDVFDRDILDISWAEDGTTLYACSSEGRVAVFIIQELKSIVTMAPPEAKVEFHKTYSFKKPERLRQPRSMSINYASRNPSPLISTGSHITSPSPDPSYRISHPSSDIAPSDLPQKQQTTIMPNGKRRIRPVYLGANDSVMFPLLQVNGRAIAGSSTENLPLPSTQPPSPMKTEPIEEYTPHSCTDAQFASFLTDELKPVATHDNGMGETIRWRDGGSWGDGINAPDELSSTVNSGDDELKLCCKNLDTMVEGNAKKSRARLIAVAKDLVLWENDFNERQIVSAAVSSSYSAIGFLDNSLLVFNRSGRRVLPMLVLDSACFLIHLRNRLLMAITLNGTIMVWDLSLSKMLGSSIRMQDLHPSKSFVAFSGLTSAGLPIIASEDGSLYTYDRDLQSWVVLVDSKDLTGDRRSPSQLESMAHIDGSESSLNAAMVLSSRSDLEICLNSYVNQLIDQRALSKAKDLCEELWSGCSGAFGRESCTGRLKITRNYRLKLLAKTLNTLNATFEFQSIFNEYSVLLRHSKPT
ncbi:WD40-repeat-containing domain protein, partial [Phakopsora pachyrhizi]